MILKKCWYDYKTQKAKEFNIHLEDVSIYDLKFGSEFMKSIERKQVAQQEAEKYKYIVMKAEEEKKAKIIESEGNSIAAQMISNAVAKYGSSVLELKKLESALYISKKLTETNNISFIPGGNNILLNLNR